MFGPWEERGVTISLAVIAKNEARTLGRCLESVRGAVDEIVVVDTGSTDGTRRVAADYTDRVFDFAWSDDFAAARQFAFDQTTGDWVLWLDADDVVIGADRIRALVAGASGDVAGFYWRYVLGRDAAGTPTVEFWRERCVRNDGRFRWVGRVHEVLVAPRPAALVRSAAVTVEHHPEADRGPGEQGRNLRLLEAEVAAAGEAIEPRRLFYLGREYADAGDADKAIGAFDRYLAVGTWDDERYAAQTRIADLHRGQARYAEAIDADLRALAILPRWPDAYFGLAKSYYFLADWPKVIHWTDVGRAMPVPETLLFVNPSGYAAAWVIYYTNALYRVGDLRGALVWTRRALELLPDDPWHSENLGYFSRLLDAATVVPTLDPAAAVPTYAVIPVRDRHELTRRLVAQLGLPPNRVVVVDNSSAVPARDALDGMARIVAHAPRNLSALWNVGLDLVAAECPGPHNVAVLNNDLDVPPGFLDGLADGLRARPDHVVAYPDAAARLPPGVCDPIGRMTGHAFMLRGEEGLRADPRFVWWYGDDDLERQGRVRGQVVCVGGVRLRHLEPNASTVANPELAAIAEEDAARFRAKWG